MKFLFGCVIILLSCCLLAGCSFGSENDFLNQTTALEETLTSEGVVDMKDTVRMFVECIGIEEDCAQGAVEQALRLSVPQIVSVEKQDSKHGFVALVADEQGNHYKFGFGGLGYLEYIYSVERDTYLYFARG